MSETHIRTSGLSLFYHDIHILKNIAINIPARQTTAIIGPSGCGKTTLLKCLNRMIDLVPGVRVTGKVIVGGNCQPY